MAKKKEAVEATKVDPAYEALIIELERLTEERVIADYGLAGTHVNVDAVLDGVKQEIQIPLDEGYAKGLETLGALAAKLTKGA